MAQDAGQPLRQLDNKPRLSKMNIKHACSKIITITTLTAISALNCFAAGTIVVESRKADGTLNSPAWAEVSGKWGTSKNKTRVADASSLVATNVSACVTNSPVPAIKISPELEAGTTYKVEVTFSTSTSYAAAPDLIVAVTADGVSASTIPTNTPAFQGSGANDWNALGTITPSTKHPALTFTYVSGTLSRESRWYADAIRFTPEAAPKKAE
jgi:hypothetical protein